MVKEVKKRYKNLHVFGSWSRRFYVVDQKDLMDDSNPEYAHNKSFESYHLLIKKDMWGKKQNMKRHFNLHFTYPQIAKKMVKFIIETQIQLLMDDIIHGKDAFMFPLVRQYKLKMCLLPPHKQKKFKYNPITRGNKYVLAQEYIPGRSHRRFYKRIREWYFVLNPKWKNELNRLVSKGEHYE